MTTDTPADGAKEYTLPRYKCHKEVNAARVTGVVWAPDDKSAVLHTAYGQFTLVPREGVHFEEGGYVVQYGDGYVSYSPAAAFEDGYTLIGEPGEDAWTGPAHTPDYRDLLSLTQTAQLLGIALKAFAKDHASIVATKKAPPPLYTRDGTPMDPPQWSARAVLAWMHHHSSAA